MPGLQNVFQLQTMSGAPIQAGEMVITPQSQALRIRLPFGGFVWNRPVAVLVARNGEVQRVPIVDTTRLIQLALLGLTLTFALAARVITTRRKESERERKSK